MNAKMPLFFNVKRGAFKSFCISATVNFRQRAIINYLVNNCFGLIDVITISTDTCDINIINVVRPKTYK